MSYDLPPSYEESERHNREISTRVPPVIGYVTESSTDDPTYLRLYGISDPSGRLAYIQRVIRRVSGDLAHLENRLDADSTWSIAKQHLLRKQLDDFTRQENALLEQLSRSTGQGRHINQEPPTIVIHQQTQNFNQSPSVSVHPDREVDLIPEITPQMQENTEVEQNHDIITGCCMACVLCILFLIPIVACIIIGANHDSHCDNSIVNLSTWLIVIGILQLVSVIISFILFSLKPIIDESECASIVVFIYKFIIYLFAVIWLIIGSITFWRRCYDETSTPVATAMWFALIFSYMGILIDVLYNILT